MARQIIVFTLVLFAVVGFACALSPAEAPNSPSSGNSDVDAAILAPGSDNEIGNTDGDVAEGPSEDDVVEGPVGSEGPGAAFGPSSEQHKSGAPSVVEVSAVFGITAISGLFLF